MMKTRLRTALAVLLFAVGSVATVSCSSDNTDDTSNNNQLHDVRPMDTDDASPESRDVLPDGTSDVQQSEEVRIEGDVASRASCATLCGERGLTCNEEHEFQGVGSGGGIATWGPISFVLDCTESPAETRDDFNGQTHELDEYFCYCI